LSRIAFVSPLPPRPTGIADYSAEVLALLAGRHEIDAFHSQQEVEGLPAGCRPRRVEELLPQHRERPYDAVAYQMGNGPEHAFLYEPLARIPGLLVLHELVLHHSRARMFLDTPEARAYAADPSNAALRDAAQASLRPYREELAYAYPGRAERLMDAQLSTVGDLLPYAYPLFRLPVEASRLTAVHNAFSAEAVRAEVPGAEVVRIPMAAAAAPVASADVTALRARYGFGADDLIVATFGLLTREKRLATIVRAVARASVALPRLRLLLVGAVADPEGLRRELDAFGIAPRTIVTGRVPFAELAAHMELADVVIHLRYPSARETSAALLRVLAQGRPTVISDLEHLADVPQGVVLRADVRDEEGEVTRGLVRLATRPALRAQLGAAAAAFIRREHAPALCRAAYEAALERAAALPDPPPRPWPAHWRRLAITQ
jgi:glycosyltransferase involved in cell wall biosynthesis